MYVTEGITRSQKVLKKQELVEGNLIGNFVLRDALVSEH